ncbi:hypothetical protein L3Q82_010711 [Scortum barcoo]|uniref:Uncharacterized protein n=1 Tax=Scortum barcoo TaxID=214431 RepID=A0ACB8WD73_9TELE|nr:hypothetical protein L3Q82_010711 [Scortum barcoo]
MFNLISRNKQTKHLFIIQKKKYKMDTKIKVPQALKAKVMLWTDVSYHDMEELDNMQSIADLERALSSVFGVDLPEPKRGVLLELYVQTVLFCRERGFKKEQTSALLSIIKSVHEANVETPLNNIEECFKYCKELLLCHSVRRPPFSISLFNYEEVNCVLKYIHDSYVRHYKLYKYILTPQYTGPQLFIFLSPFPAPDVENVMETEAASKAGSSPKTQEASITEKSTLGRITYHKELGRNNCSTGSHQSQVLSCENMMTIHDS